MTKRAEELNSGLRRATDTLCVGSSISTGDHRMLCDAWLDRFWSKSGHDSTSKPGPGSGRHSGKERSVVAYFAMAEPFGSVKRLSRLSASSRNPACHRIGIRAGEKYSRSACGLNPECSCARGRNLPGKLTYPLRLAGKMISSDSAASQRRPSEFLVRAHRYDRYFEADSTQVAGNETQVPLETEYSLHHDPNHVEQYAAQHSYTGNSEQFRRNGALASQIPGGFSFVNSNDDQSIGGYMAGRESDENSAVGAVGTRPGPQLSARCLQQKPSAAT
nr:hypothetical protein CFP56_67625 [Quercus suber]